MGYYTKNGGLIGFGTIDEKRGVFDINASQLIGDALYTFSSFTFTTGGRTGQYGPTYAQCASSYSGEPFLDSTDWFTVSTAVAGVQRWTVPETATYEFTARGGMGGKYQSGWGAVDPRPGRGALVTARFVLTQGTIVNLVVGQRPANSNNNTSGSAGGGGSFVYTGADSSSSIGGSGLLLAAGGGGGTGHGQNSGNACGSGAGGNNSTNSREFTDGQYVGGEYVGGTCGNNGIGMGGNATINTSHGGAGGGAGWQEVGDTRTGPGSYPGEGGDHWVGGEGPRANDDGGFGGGGGAGGNHCAGGGGGGYTGGGAGEGWGEIPSTPSWTWGGGGGGGSYVHPSGTNQSMSAGSDAYSNVTQESGSIQVTKL